MAALQFAIMKAGFTNVKCICRDRDGFPEVGQTLILCENCGTWVHQPCIIGLVMPRIPKNGYQCSACMKAYRYEIGRKGVETKKRNQAKLREEAGYYGNEESPVPTKKVAGHWIRQYPLGNPDGTVQKGWIRQYPVNPNKSRNAQQNQRQLTTLKYGKGNDACDVASAPVATGSLRQIRKAREEYEASLAKSAAQAGSESEVLDDGVVNNETNDSPVVVDILEREKAILYVRHKLLKGLLARETVPQESDMMQVNNMITQLEKYDRDGYFQPGVLLSTKIHKVVKAIANLPGIPIDFNLDQRCTALWAIWSQRLESVTTSIEDDNKSHVPTNDLNITSQVDEDEVLCDCPEDTVVTVKHTFKCASCKRKQHKGCIRVGGRRTRKSLVICNLCRAARADEALIREKNNAMGVMQDGEDAALREYCETILWKMYCDLPCGESCSETLRNLTVMDYNDGNPVPHHPAPVNWVNEIFNRINDMIKLAGNQKMEQLLGVQSDGAKYDQPFAPGLRELAVWMIHHGPYKGDKSQLGLLSEVVGLDTKGSLWKI